MRLNESIEDDIIDQYKLIDKAFENLKSECKKLVDICEDNENLKFESNLLYDFCSEELYKKLKNAKEAILDEYYPINYAEDEDDHIKAGEIYRNSKEERDAVFDDNTSTTKESKSEEESEADIFDDELDELEEE